MTDLEGFDAAAVQMRALIERDCPADAPIAYMLTTEPGGRFILFASGAAADGVRAMLGLPRTSDGMEEKLRRFDKSKNN
jgi:hypothetical protein